MRTATSPKKYFFLEELQRPSPRPTNRRRGCYAEDKCLSSAILFATRCMRSPPLSLLSGEGNQRRIGRILPYAFSYFLSKSITALFWKSQIGKGARSIRHPPSGKTHRMSKVSNAICRRSAAAQPSVTISTLAVYHSYKKGSSRATQSPFCTIYHMSSSCAAPFTSTATPHHPSAVNNHALPSSPGTLSPSASLLRSPQASPWPTYFWGSFFSSPPFTSPSSDS